MADAIANSRQQMIYNMISELPWLVSNPHSDVQPNRNLRRTTQVHDSARLFRHDPAGPAGPDSWSAEADLRKATTTTRLTRHQIDELFAGITDVAATLDNADPARLAAAYDKLGLRLTYDPAGLTVHATANPRPGNIGNWYVSEGRAEPFAYAGRLSAEFTVGGRP